MTVYIDRMGHMVADTKSELHAFAKKIGLKEEWYQDKRLPHYDVWGSMVKHALDGGAEQISYREMVQRSKDMGE